MGVDEGYMIVHNEMQRVIALSKALAKKEQA
jgi:methylaspartate ammonia-lyase